jgi:hypothetical protein
MEKADKPPWLQIGVKFMHPIALNSLVASAPPADMAQNSIGWFLANQIRGRS